MNQQQRCPWCGNDPLYQQYHDKVWGRPVYDPKDLFAKLCLDGQQAGLSWITILRKQKTYYQAYADFEPTEIAKFDQAKIEELLQNPGIIRNKLKVNSVIRNANGCNRFREIPLADKKSLVNILESYPSIFEKSYLEKMAQKLGLTGDAKTHQVIIENTLSMMKSCQLDFSYFFRQLSNIHQAQTHKHLRDLCLDITAFDAWFTTYKDALTQNQQPLNSKHDTERQTRMNQVNPKYILRNYLAQNAISAAQSGDYSEVQKLFTVLQKPFDEQPEYEDYAKLPPEWGKTLEISCSS